MHADANYFQRLEHLLTEICCFINQIDCEVGRSKTIRDTAEALHEYAQKQFVFFYAGLPGTIEQTDINTSINDFLQSHCLEYFKDCDDNIPTLKLCSPSSPEDYPNYTRERILDRLLEQIAADLITLRHAYFDRQMGEHGKHTLHIADLFAQDALGLAMCGDLISKQTTVLTYFDKAHSVRVIPYAPVAMIGIPSSCLYEKRDFLVIAHEIGHYVYWHARMYPEEGSQSFCADKTTSKNINKTVNDPRLTFKLFDIVKNYKNKINFTGNCFKQNSDAQELENSTAQENIESCLEAFLEQWNSNTQENIKNSLNAALVQWQEEIFADLYGVLVAGPAIALEFQSILSDNYLLTQNNGIHPVTIVRPSIHVKVLDNVIDWQLGLIFNRRGELSQFRTKFWRQLWKPLIHELGISMESPIFLFYNDSFICPESLRCILGELVDELFNSLKDYFFDVPYNEPINNSRSTSKNNHPRVSSIQTIWQLKKNPWTPIERSDLNFEKLRPEIYSKFESYEIFDASKKKVVIEEFDESWDKPQFYFDCLFEKWTEECEKIIMPFSIEDTLNCLTECGKKRTTDVGWRDLISRSGWGVGGPECDGTNPP